METKSTKQYELQFFDNYVIAEAKEGVIITSEEIKKNLRVVFDYFDGKDFTIISHRKNNYTLEIDVYTTRLMKKVRALAIVSKDSLTREKAALEQLQFDNSFAFFDNLEDAREWAKTVSVS